MPLDYLRAFVLSHTPVAEQDKLLQLLNAERGLIRAYAPGAGKMKNRFGAALELFTENDFHYYWSETKESITISKCEIVHSYYHLISRPENIYYFHLIAEILLKMIPPGENSQRIYKLIHAILSGREEGLPMDYLLLYFLIWLLRIEGFLFDPALCYNCFSRGIETGWLKHDFRGIVCPACHQNEPYVFHARELALIANTAQHSPQQGLAAAAEARMAHMIRAFIKKTEYHAEYVFKSTIYLPEFK